jgi:hypothetical protein
MLNKWDIEFMEQTVRDTITSWGNTITVLSPLPVDQQPNYNRYMHEYTGEIKFGKLVVPAEHKDIVNNQTNDMSNDVIYGNEDAGAVLFSIPDVIPTYGQDGKQNGTRPYKPGAEDVFILDASNDRYYIRAMRERLGETLVLLNRYTGGTPNGTGTLEVV